MSDEQTSVEVKTTGPSYLGWRGELLAELALARVPGLTVHKRPERRPSEQAYDFLVATDHGFCFFVEVRAFSSSRQNVANIEAVSELRWSLDAELIRRARESLSPVILFLFDADTDHGRYLRLDTLPAPEAVARRLTIRLPLKFTINKGSLEKLLTDLQCTVRS